MNRRRAFFGALAATLACGVAQAGFALDGTIMRIGNASASRGDDYSTVDFVPFSALSTGSVTFDILSWEIDHTAAGRGTIGRSVDLNGDGEMAFIDSQIYLFRNDGSLGVDDLIAWNDDSYDPRAAQDGSVAAADSFLDITLDPGDYILAIGSFYLSVDDAVSGMNTRQWQEGPQTFDGTSMGFMSHGDYRLAVTGDVRGVVVPLPTGAGLGLAGLLLLTGLSLSRRSRH